MQHTLWFTNIRTMQLGWTALLSFIVGCLLDAIPLWSWYGIHTHVLEWIGGGFAWLGYFLLWFLLPVSAFRPEGRFYLHGDCSLRARRFSQIFGLLLLVHLGMFLMIVWALQGGWS